MATIKSHTDLPQSKKLAEFLPLESADMKWFVPADNEGEFIEEVNFINSKSEYTLFDKVTDWNDTPYIPCWSLAALLDILPYPSLAQHANGLWSLVAWVDKVEAYSVGDSVCGYDNEIDACVAMIEKLHELKML